MFLQVAKGFYFLKMIGIFDGSMSRIGEILFFKTINDKTMEKQVVYQEKTGLFFLKQRKQAASWIMNTIAPRMLKYFFPKKSWDYTLEDYRAMPEGSLGNDVAKLLDYMGYGFIEKGEHHDARHIILEYEMGIIDEIRMQAFMIGNSGWKLVSWLWVAVGAVLIPEYIGIFKQDYIRGKNSGKIAHIAWAEYLTLPSGLLRREFNIVPNFFNSKLCNSKYFL